MSAEKQFKKEIAKLESEIEELEAKRARSEAYIIDALLTSTPLDENDVRFFRSYSTQIEQKRERILELQAQLDTLK